MAEHVADGTLRVLREKIRDQMNILADHVAEGNCKDFNEYAHLTGKINGLAEAERFLFDLDRSMTQD